MQILDQVECFDRALNVESKNKTCASLCYLHNITILQFVIKKHLQDKIRSSSSFSNPNEPNLIPLEHFKNPIFRKSLPNIHIR